MGDSGGDTSPAELLGIPGLEVLERIGSGGFAVVYRARQTRFARDVAVKVIENDDLDDVARGRFERECQALGQLSTRPGIVTVYEGGFSAAGRPYLVMEYYAGGSLADRVRDDGPLPWAEVASIGADVASALEAAHQAGIVHRDIKPANLFVGEHGQVAIGDFGIARVQGAAATASGVVTASLAHVPPEVLDQQPPTPRSDLYSLGSTLYELAAGKAPFGDYRELGVAALFSRITAGAVPDLRRIGVPGPLATVIERAMQRSPEDRWESADQMAAALRRIVPSESTVPVVAATPDDATIRLPHRRPPPSTALKPQPAVSSSRRAIIAIVAGVTALLTLVALVGAVVVLRRDDPAGPVDAVATTTTATSGSSSTTDASTSAEVDPDLPESYFTTDGSRPQLSPSCLGLLSFCLRQPLDAATEALGTEDERFSGEDGESFHFWDLTPDVRLSVQADADGSMTSLTLTTALVDGSGDFRAFAPEGGLFGEMTMADVLGQYGTEPTEEALPGEGFVLYTYSYLRGGEGSATLEFTHGAAFDEDPGAFNSELNRRPVTSVTVRET